MFIAIPLTCRRLRSASNLQRAACECGEERVPVMDDGRVRLSIH
jgi:hypothetical protein